MNNPQGLVRLPACRPPAVHGAPPTHTHKPPQPTVTHATHSVHPPPQIMLCRDLYAYLRVGPPLYMVVGPVSVAAGSPDINKLCSIAGCRTDSLAVRVSGASAHHCSYCAVHIVPRVYISQAATCMSPAALPGHSPRFISSPKQLEHIIIIIIDSVFPAHALHLYCIIKPLVMYIVLLYCRLVKRPCHRPQASSRHQLPHGLTTSCHGPTPACPSAAGMTVSGCMQPYGHY
jgi:hypothetical protein